MKKQLKRLLSTLLTICMIIGLFSTVVVPASAEPSGYRAVFSDTDKDQVYFAGNTMAFQLTYLPAGIPKSTPIRMSFGLMESGSFTPTRVISGLSGGESDPYGYYKDTTVESSDYGGITGIISGTIMSGLQAGIVAVRLYIYNTSTNNWDVSVTIPLSNYDLKSQVLVGFESILPEGVTCYPDLKDIDNFYSGSVSLEFTKNLGSGIGTGSIHFKNLSFGDSSDFKALASLNSGLEISNVSVPSAGNLAEFSLGIDKSSLYFLSVQPATLSLTSDSLFGGKTASDFAVAGDSFSNMAFDSSTNTFTFDVGHFSSYKVSLLASTDAPSVSNIYINRISADLINVNYTGTYVNNSTIRLYDVQTGGTARGAATLSADGTAVFNNYSISSGTNVIYVTRQDPSKKESSRTAITISDYDIDPPGDFTFSALTPGYTKSNLKGETFKLTNTGRTYQTGVSVKLYPVDAPFIITQPDGTIYLDDSDTTSFTVKPKTGLAEGSYSATVTVSSDYTSDKTFTVTQVVDGTAPVPGTEMPLQASDITANSLKLKWTKASDNYTVSSSITYYIVKSASGNIGTVSDCLSAYSNSQADLLNGLEGTANIDTYTVTKLSPSTTYYFNIIAFDSASNKATYTMITATTASSSSGGGSGGGGNTATAATTITQTSEGGSTKVTAEVASTKSAAGVATASVPENTLTDLTLNAANAEKSGQHAVVEIKVNTAGASSATVQIPAAALSSIASTTNADVTISTGVATVTFDFKAVESISGAASGDVKVGIAAADKSTLPAEAKATVGNRPVYDFSVTIGDSKLSSFGGGSVAVGIPYTPLSGEDKNAIVVYYIDSTGGLQCILGAYNAMTGKVEFKTTHFSKYAVGYNKVSFSDVPDSAWYGSAVTFIAARNITTGTSAGAFSPNETLRRGQFIVMLMRAYGISPDERSENNFTDAGGDYYTNYLSAAKRLGITTGLGDNMFGPELEISRQDMFTLIYRALDKLLMLPNAASGKKISDFIDAWQVSDYAKTAISSLVGSGKISGSGGRLDPFGKTTRAEMAQVLYNLLTN